MGFILDIAIVGAAILLSVAVFVSLMYFSEADTQDIQSIYLRDCVEFKGEFTPIEQIDPTTGRTQVQDICLLENKFCQVIEQQWMCDDYLNKSQLGEAIEQT